MSTLWAGDLGAGGVYATHRVCDGCGATRPMYTQAGNPAAWTRTTLNPPGWTRVEREFKVCHYCRDCSRDSSKQL